MSQVQEKGPVPKTDQQVSGQKEQYFPLSSRDEMELDIARMFDGCITLIAAVRCGLHCGAILHVYPGIEQTMTRELAKDFAERHGWKYRVRQGDHMWICPQCLSQTGKKVALV